MKRTIRHYSTHLQKEEADTLSARARLALVVIRFIPYLQIHTQNITARPNKLLSSAKLLVCFNFQCASMSLKSWWKCLSVKQLGSRWDAELLGVSSGSKLFAHGTIVVFGGLTVKLLHALMEKKLRSSVQGNLWINCFIPMHLMIFGWVF